MCERLRRLIALLYPRAWRDRYGEEFSALLDDSPARWRDLPDLLRSAVVMQIQLQSWKMVALTSLCGLVVAAAIWLRQPPQFTSVARIQANQANSIPYLSLFALGRPALAEIVNRVNLYEHERSSQPLEDVVKRMRNDIRVEADPRNGSEFTIQFRCSDAQKAQAVTRDLVAQFMFENVRESMKSHLRDSTLRQVDPPILSSRPQRAFSAPVFLWGLGVGILAGLIMLQPLRRTLKLIGFALAGLIVGAAPLYWMSDDFKSTAVIAIKRGNIETSIAPRQGDLQVEEIPMSGGAPRVYRLSATRPGQLEAQHALTDAVRKLPFEAYDVIVGPTYALGSVSPKRLILPVCGALCAFLYGLRRTRQSGGNAHYRDVLTVRRTPPAQSEGT